MVFVTEVYNWFKEAPAHIRIDFIYNILQLCLPNELRYFSTILEDMNNKDYGTLREMDEKSNVPNEFRQFPHSRLTPENVHKLCLSLSLLKSTNQQVAQAIYEILRIHFEYAKQCMSSNDEFSAEILLVYLMACYHPAFTFKNKTKLSKYLEQLHSKSETNTSSISKNSNNNCCISKDETNPSILDCVSIKVTDVIIENDDAKLTIEVTRNYESDKIIKKRYTNFKTIKKFILDLSNSHSMLFIQESIESLSKNGSFNSQNIKNVLTKSINKFCSHCPSLNYKISTFLSRLPVSITRKDIKKEQKSIQDGVVTKSHSNTDEKFVNSVIPITNPISSRTNSTKSNVDNSLTKLSHVSSTNTTESLCKTSRKSVVISVNNAIPQSNNNITENNNDNDTNGESLNLSASPLLLQKTDTPDQLLNTIITTTSISLNQQPGPIITIPTPPLPPNQLNTQIKQQQPINFYSLQFKSNNNNSNIDRNISHYSDNSKQITQDQISIRHQKSSNNNNSTAFLSQDVNLNQRSYYQDGSLNKLPPTPTQVVTPNSTTTTQQQSTTFPTATLQQSMPLSQQPPPPQTNYSIIDNYPTNYLIFPISPYVFYNPLSQPTPSQSNIECNTPTTDASSYQLPTFHPSFSPSTFIGYTTMTPQSCNSIHSNSMISNINSQINSTVTTTPSPSLSTCPSTNSFYYTTPTTQQQHRLSANLSSSNSNISQQSNTSNCCVAPPRLQQQNLTQTNTQNKTQPI